MDKKIFKFDLDKSGLQYVKIHEGAKILSLQIQNGEFKLWALVDPDADYERMPIEMFGTGHTVPEANRKYIATVQDGPYVWHFFKLLSFKP